MEKADGNNDNIEKNNVETDICETTDIEQILRIALDIGEKMLCCGAEINRVEDTTYRICHTYTDFRIDAFSITSLIMLSVTGPDGHVYTQCRRISSYGTDLHRLEEYNALSRYICENRPSISDIESRLSAIANTKYEVKWQLFIGYILSAASFAIFFGGNLKDALCAALIAVLIFFLDHKIKKTNGNRIAYTVMCSTLSGIMAVLLTFAGIGSHTDKIMIGDIMLLIPGLALVNSLRDLLSGDIMTGIFRLVEAVILAVAIACGFALSLILLKNLV